MTNLPEAHEPHFPELIRANEATLPQPEQHYRNLLKQKGLSGQQRFAALYGLLHRLRREARFPEYVELVRKYDGEFSGEPYFDTFRVIAAKWSGDDPRSLREALEPASRAIEAFPDEPGVLHQYAELIVTLAEIDSGTSKKQLRVAGKSVNRAIALSRDKNANHFSTRARLMVLKGDYRSARADVATAISLEDPSAPDFLRRISRYEGIRSMIGIRRAYEDFVEERTKLLAELNSFRREQLQMLGLLAAVIALIVGGITLATRVDAVVAVRLILLSSGAVALIFGGLASLLARAPLGRVVVALSIGTALIGAGIWLVP